MMTAYNTRSPGTFSYIILISISTAVKRLMREAQELSQPTELYYAQPLEDNLFEWHFTIRGPEGSEFEGGIYHGQISLPTEYPMKPPNIMLLTPNGRFEQYRQICLSISGYHPETWCPSWSIRTALLAIIGFMPTSGAGAIGSMSISTEERRKLAASSRNFICDICGPTRDLLLPLTSTSSSTVKEAQEVASQCIITDPVAPKEMPSESRDAKVQPEAQKVSKNDVYNGGIPSAFPPQLSALQGMPRPAYWLCYPIFLSNGTTSANVPGTAAGDIKREPPLSFEEWLKKVHECPSASGGTGSESSPTSTCKSPSAKPPNSPTDQVRVNAVAASESSAETEEAEAVPQTVPDPEPSEKLEAVEAETLEEPSGCRPASSSPPTTIVLDDAVRAPPSGAESGSFGSSVAVCYSGGGSRRPSPGPERPGPTASLHCESPMPVERTCSMPSEPLPQYASSSVTQGPRVVPLPSKEAAKEAAQRILQDAAERHRQRVCAMQTRLERTPAGGMVTAGASLLPQETQWVKWVAVAVATALIALLLRRLMIMSTTGLS
uniref:Ubiquitin conjugating enzyme E2 J1 n=1 Tax=Echinococcus granulosus TaxID=6210 RepID=A0A068WXN9_ECHGR|nr:Ubiquitin conjugating enzyme E2 J1 [Echinococcus granulosus]